MLYYTVFFVPNYVPKEICRFVPIDKVHFLQNRLQLRHRLQIKSLQLHVALSHLDFLSKTQNCTSLKRRLGQDLVQLSLSCSAKLKAAKVRLL